MNNSTSPRGNKLDAEVLTIGDELNRGEIVDTNSSYLAERLTSLGALLSVLVREAITRCRPRTNSRPTW